MTIARIMEMLMGHIGNLQAAYSLAMARVDMPEALRIEAEMNTAKHSLALLETIKDL